jgi:hypothetical protein
MGAAALKKTALIVKLNKMKYFFGGLMVLVALFVFSPKTTEAHVQYSCPTGYSLGGYYWYFGLHRHCVADEVVVEEPPVVEEEEPVVYSPVGETGGRSGDYATCIEVSHTDYPSGLYCPNEEAKERYEEQLVNHINILLGRLQTMVSGL